MSALKAKTAGARDKLADLDPAQQRLELWKFRRLLGWLGSARGNGTSMISLVIGQGDQTSRVAKMLVEEYGTASNIKSRTNRMSVLSAITSAQQRLKLHQSTPPNGLALYVGTVVSDNDGKEKKVTVCFEPFRPVRTSMYMCDSRFHVGPLEDLARADDAKYGIIVVDGKSAMFGTVCGSTKEVVHSFSVDLPKKHNKGGQSALRFSRLREEKRHNYVRKVCEAATRIYISPTTAMPTVRGIVLAGAADFKTELTRSDLFDPRLSAIVVCTVDVAYGGDVGFNHALEASSGALSDLRLVQEKKLISRLFNALGEANDTAAVGVEETMCCLEAGAVELLLIWEGLEVREAEADMDAASDDVHKDGNGNDNCDKGDNGGECERRPLLLDRLVQEHSKYGCTLEIVSDKTQEGSQFCKGLGGIGAVLRYAIDIDAHLGRTEADMDAARIFDDDSLDDVF